jgi:hypothetical protein
VEEENWGYRSYETLEELNRAYRDLLLHLRPLIAQGLSAAVYTQTTDVEIEVNGVMTYDREITKLDDPSVALHAGLYASQPRLTEVVPTSRGSGGPWRFTEEDPGREWFTPEFDDGAWALGNGGFGNRRPPGSRAGTPWESGDLWLRRTFDLSGEALGGMDPGTTFLWLEHDEDAQVYLNGTLVATLEGHVNGYRLHPLGPESLALLHEGTNTLAVHVRNTEGGQFIDVGLVRWPGGSG